MNQPARAIQMIGPGVAVACPECGEKGPLGPSRRVRCIGCGTRFDLLRPSEPGESTGPFREGAVEARVTSPPPDDDLEDLSGGSRTRYVRLFARRRAAGLSILVFPLALGLLAGSLMGLWVFANAAAHSRPIPWGTTALVFAVVTALSTGLLGAATLTARKRREIWIAGDRLYWGRRRSRPLSEIDALCLEPHDVSTGGGSTGRTTVTTWALAFPLASGAASRFLPLHGLSEEGREWLVRHLNEGISLAKASSSSGS